MLPDTCTSTYKGQNNYPRTKEMPRMLSVCTCIRKQVRWVHQNTGGCAPKWCADPLGAVGAHLGPCQLPEGAGQDGPWPWSGRCLRALVPKWRHGVQPSTCGRWSTPGPTGPRPLGCAPARTRSGAHTRGRSPCRSGAPRRWWGAGPLLGAQCWRGGSGPGWTTRWVAAAAVRAGGSLCPCSSPSPPCPLPAADGWRPRSGWSRWWWCGHWPPAPKVLPVRSIGAGPWSHRGRCPQQYVKTFLYNGHLETVRTQNTKFRTKMYFTIPR